MAISSKKVGEIPNFPPAQSHLIVAFETLELLSQILQQTAQGPETIVIMEDILKAIPCNHFPGVKFTAVISKEFNGLLWATLAKEKELSDSQRQKIENHQKSYSYQFNSSSLLFSRGDMENLKFNLGLTFAPEAIAFFLSQIIEQLEANKSELVFASKLKSRINNIRVNNPHLQSEFTLKLVEFLSSSQHKVRRNKISKNYKLLGTNSLPNLQQDSSLFHPIEKILHQQLEQERLLHQVTTHIRQSLELPVILSTAVEQVRKFIQADRLLIYQFNHSLSLKNEIKDLNLQKGCVNYEALASNKISSVLGLTEIENCFVEANNYLGKSGKNLIQAIADVEVAYKEFPYFLQLMQQHQVKAKLVVPIIVYEQLWGLLIAQQCSCRDWEENENIFLQEIAEHLAIAIYQAQLYAELQQQKETLEKRVIERTQDIYDTLQSTESANRAKSEFLATMSHELRTPLTCVIGISSTLLRWSYGNRGAKKIPIEKQRNYLQTIHDSGEHLLELINDILDLSQVEAGKAVLKISDFSISKLSSEVWHNFREKADQKQVKLSLEQNINQNKDCFTADKRRVKQILFNLLSNAIKFTASGGSVKLKVSHTSNTLIFQIEDTGIGISPAQKTLLFKKFQQLDSPYNRQQGGTGLGLALTKQLVELHGGIIEVESTVNVGSTFRVTLPAQSLKSETKTNKLKEETASNTKNLFLQGTIVLIEQKEEIATVICDILTAAGLKVVWIMEGSVAVEQIILLQPIVVIVDMQLPGMDGIEIVQQLSTTNTTKNIKILALTIPQLQTDQKSYDTAGVDEYLIKPINLEDLLSKMIDLVTKSQKN